MIEGSSQDTWTSTKITKRGWSIPIPC